MPGHPIGAGVYADHLARKSRNCLISRNGINDPHGVRTDPPHGGHIVGAEYLNRYTKWPLSSTGSNNKLLMGRDLEFKNPTMDEIRI